MSSSTNPSSLLVQLRSVVPARPLLYAEALRIAELQANRFLMLSGVTEPGTPSEVVTDLRFVQVSRRSDLPASGYTDWYKPHWLIILSRSEPLVRQRFTLMHEFKHVLDHPFVAGLYPSTGTNTSEARAESVADHFAACVLMPKRFVKRLFGEGHQKVSELANIFGVSEVAMAYRLRQLGLTEPVARCSHAKTRPPVWRGYFRQAWRETPTGAVIGVLA